jgi:hypothetical protein
MPKFVLSAATKPTDTQAGAAITNVAAEIDAIISSAGYVVPVATPAWFVTYLKFLNALGAAALVLRAMFPASRAAGEASLSEYALYQHWYETGLTRLAASGGIPSAAPANSSTTIAPSTYFTRNPNVEETLGDISEPTFKRNMVL